MRWFAIIAAAVTLLICALPSHASTVKQKPSPRFLVVQQLQHGLAGTPLAPYAWALEREGFRWNVSPFFMAAISGTESSFGAAACGGNAWGIGSCVGYSFASFREGIAFEARMLRTFYFDAGYRTIEQVGGRYAACGSCWAAKTGWFMRSNFGVSASSLTYPR